MGDLTLRQSFEIVNGQLIEKAPGGSPQAPRAKLKPRREYTVLTTLGQHPDALYLSASWDLPERARVLLGAAKIAAQDSDDRLSALSAVEGVPGGVFYVKPHGRKKYQYVVENADMYLELTTWKNLPTLQLQFKAHFLYEYGLTAAETVARRVLRAFGAPAGTDLKVTRFDLAVDFQPPSTWIPPDMADVVTRARSRYVNYDRSKVNAVTLGERTGALQVQIYNKSNELLTSGKTWMYEVWRASGKYREGMPVWRLEVRFFRLGLHQFGINSIRDLRSSLGDLVGYALGEDGPWVRVAEPSTRHYSDSGHSGRRGGASWWAKVTRAAALGLSSAGRKRRRPPGRSSFTRSIKMAGAHLSKACAIARLSGLSDHLTAADFGKWVGEVIGSDMVGSGTSWPERVNDAMLQLRGEYAAA